MKRTQILLFTLVALSFAGCDGGGDEVECTVGFDPDGTVMLEFEGQDVDFPCVQIGAPQSGGATIRGENAVGDPVESVVVRIGSRSVGVYEAEPGTAEEDRAGFEYISPDLAVTLGGDGTVTVDEFSDQRVRGSFDLTSTDGEPITGDFNIRRSGDESSAVVFSETVADTRSER